MQKLNKNVTFVVLQIIFIFLNMQTTNCHHRKSEINAYTVKGFLFIYCSKQFTEIIKVAYEYVILQTKNFLQEPLISTGFRPHVSLAADKSTPHRETNHAIMVILPVDGKRVALPIDAPIVYSNTEEEFDLQGGSGEDLAQQVVTVVKDKLGFNHDDMQYI